MLRKKVAGFTLIELLIVVAIIAILAAIAVPNFLEAQIRSKVSREKSNMRTLATALESYRVDSSKYPPDAWQYAFYQITDPRYRALELFVLTTPVAYLTSVPDAVFFSKYRDPASPPSAMTEFRTRLYGYNSYLSFGVMPALATAFGYTLPAGTAIKYEWSLASIGPDMLSSAGSYMLYGEDVLNHLQGMKDSAGKYSITPGALYDPTNGTMSVGDIVRVGP